MVEVVFDFSSIDINTNVNPEDELKYLRRLSYELDRRLRHKMINFELQLMLERNQHYVSWVIYVNERDKLYLTNNMVKMLCQDKICLNDDNILNRLRSRINKNKDLILHYTARLNQVDNTFKNEIRLTLHSYDIHNIFRINQFIQEYNHNLY